MRITFKCTNHKYIVTVNGDIHTFTTSKDAWSFIFNLRKAA